MNALHFILSCRSFGDRGTTTEIAARTTRRPRTVFHLTTTTGCPGSSDHKYVCYQTRRICRSILYEFYWQSTRIHPSVLHLLYHVFILCTVVWSSSFASDTSFWKQYFSQPFMFIICKPLMFHVVLFLFRLQRLFKI